MRAWLPTIVVLAAASSAWGATGELTLTVVDGQVGRPVPCRIHLKNQAGRAVNPKKVPFLYDHFVLPAVGIGTILLLWGAARLTGHWNAAIPMPDLMDAYRKAASLAHP